MFKKARIQSLEKSTRNYAAKTWGKKIRMSNIPIGHIPLINQRCQFNAVHAVKAGLASAVIECVIIHENRCVAHYINQLENGKYVDFTLGWFWSDCDYRFCRVVNEEEYSSIDKSISNLKSKICDQYLGCIDFILGIDKWDIC